MAKATLLALVNQVLSNLGESQVTVTTSLSGISLLAFNTINEILYAIFVSKDKLQPCETNCTITLTSNVATYAIDGGVFDFDKDSFIYNSEQEIVYYTPQRFDREYKKATDTNVPDKIYQFAGYWRPYPVPNTTAHNKTITYRAWKYPTAYATATATGTSIMPEGFDLTLLADYVTYKIMHYKENPQAQVYYAKVFGDGRNDDGSLNRFKSLFKSPDLTDGSIFVEPMENQCHRPTPRSSQGY